VARALAECGLLVQGCRGRVVRPSRSRPVFRYDVSYLAEGTGRPLRAVVIAKGYYREDGARTFAYMSRLWEDGFGEDSRLTIPRPFAYIPDASLLLQGQAQGKSLYLYLDEPAAALGPVRLTARWLAKLHAASLVTAPVLPYEYEVEKVGTYARVLAGLHPLYGERIRALAGAVLSSLLTLASASKTPTHGDFQPKNIFVHRGRVTVIDFDRFALAHPARDLGHFIGQSMTMSYVRTGSFDAIAPWNAAFLDEYVAWGSQTALEGLPVFVARAFLEILYYKLFVRPVKDPSFLPVWLAEAEGWLARGGGW
jgi:hypothetical protein